VDPHGLNANPDSSFYFNVDPAPTLNLNADPDPANLWILVYSPFMASL
jgi:hypothetical protein